MIIFNIRTSREHTIQDIDSKLDMEVTKQEIAALMLKKTTLLKEVEELEIQVQKLRKEKKHLELHQHGQPHTPHFEDSDAI